LLSHDCRCRVFFNTTHSQLFGQLIQFHLSKWIVELNRSTAYRGATHVSTTKTEPPATEASHTETLTFRNHHVSSWIEHKPCAEQAEASLTHECLTIVDVPAITKAAFTHFLADFCILIIITAYPQVL
jgi:hypothetical protein